MKKIKYDDVITDEHIKDAYNIIRKNTEHREKLLKYELFFLSNILTIEIVLKQKTYHHDNYNIFLVHEPKYRIIMSEKLPDKIVNHLISKYVLQPVILPLMISSNVATRKEKGTQAAINYFKFYVNKLKQKYNKMYVLKCDISKYFYSIDHEILFKKICNLVSDIDLQNIIKDIIWSTNKEDINLKIDKVVKKEIARLKKNKNIDKNRVEELKKIPRYKKGKGLPIGYMSSQVLALLYLNDLDHYIKEELNIKYYIRYMDDFLLFHPDKEYLNICKIKIEEKLKELKLTLNKKTQIIDLSKGVVFLGYRFLLKEKKLHILMSQKNKKKISRKLNRVIKENRHNKEEILASYKGYFLNCQSGSYLYKHSWYQEKKEGEKI